MASIVFFTGALACLSGVSAESAEWNNMAQSHVISGAQANTFSHFDVNYVGMMIGTDGQDQLVLHPSINPEKPHRTSMEKVTAMTAVSTRASIRKQLVSLLKSQVQIESMYGVKKEKLYQSASSVYNFISKLLHSACHIALGNDALWKEQMQCFSAYRQLLEIYSMWNGIRDVAFALEHGMSVSETTLAVCGEGAVQPEMFVGHNSEQGKLQNQYLVSQTMRNCFSNLQIRIDAERQFLTNQLVGMDAEQDRAQSCIFRVITVLTCLSAGNSENLLDLAIKDEHSQHTIFKLAAYASQVNQAAESGELTPAADDSDASEDEEAAAASFIQLDSSEISDVSNLRPAKSVPVV